MSVALLKVGHPVDGGDDDDDADEACPGDGRMRMLMIVLFRVCVSFWHLFALLVWLFVLPF